MKTKIASCLFALAVLTSCESTRTAKTGTLQQRMTRVASADSWSSSDPMPPAEGPNDIPADAPLDVNRNPGLVPSPLLRNSAASDSP